MKKDLSGGSDIQFDEGSSDDEEDDSTSEDETVIKSYIRTHLYFKGYFFFLTFPSDLVHDCC